MEKIELLSPAGGMNRLRAAVASGADAVYLGGPMFSARYGADNFTFEELREAVRFCHIYGVDVHVAVNTLIKEKELSELEEYIKELARIRVDALIVQDLGAAQLIKSVCPEMPLHASTQMTVTSLEGVRYLEKMGFSRVVLARELSKEEISYICKNARAEIEVFVHGAICMCYSGQCLFSSILGGRSGNRGRCAQPCRLPYTLTDGKENVKGYILSPKDMALINELEELKKMGVASLKIEGRLKRAEYVSAVTGIYRTYLDEPKKVSKEDMQELINAFSRTGFTDGYFKNRLGKDMMSHENPSNMENNTFSAEAIRRTGEGYIRKISVNIIASLTEGNPLEITMYDNDGNYATAVSESMAEKAKNTAIDEERLKTQLSKLGQTPYLAQSVEIYTDGKSAMSIGEINRVRREACEKLSELRAYRDSYEINDVMIDKAARKSRNTELTVQLRTKEQLKAAIECEIGKIIVPSYLVNEAKKMGYSGTIIQRTADIFKQEQLLCDEIEVSNNAATEYLGKRKIYGGARLNIYNSLSAKHYSYMESITLSSELNLGEIKAMLKNTDANVELIAYGKLSLMIMKNCPVKAAGKCANGKSSYSLIDRKNQSFPLLCLEDCKCEIVNSVPVFTADKIDDIKNIGIDSLKLVFTVEGYEECKNIIKLYQKAMNGEQIQNPYKENEFTRGHLYRGVM